MSGERDDMVSWSGQYREIRLGRYCLVSMGRVFIYVEHVAEEQDSCCVGGAKKVLRFMKSESDRCADQEEVHHG